MRLRTVVFLLLLGLVLGAPSATAAEGRARVAHRGEESGAGKPLSLLRQVGSYLVALWSNEGCRIDPWGRCATDQGARALPPAPGDASGTEVLESDAGCRIDPLGACAANL